MCGVVNSKFAFNPLPVLSMLCCSLSQGAVSQSPVKGWPMGEVLEGGGRGEVRAFLPLSLLLGALPAAAVFSPCVYLLLDSPFLPLSQLCGQPLPGL